MVLFSRVLQCIVLAAHQLAVTGLQRRACDALSFSGPFTAEEWQDNGLCITACVCRALTASPKGCFCQSSLSKLLGTRFLGSELSFWAFVRLRLEGTVR